MVETPLFKPEALQCMSVMRSLSLFSSVNVYKISYERTFITYNSAFRLFCNEIFIMIKQLVVIMTLMLGGCAYSIKNIDVSNLEPSCVRECTTSYSSCVSQGNQVGFKTETLRACQEAYLICTNTCPEK